LKVWKTEQYVGQAIRAGLPTIAGNDSTSVSAIANGGVSNACADVPNCVSARNKTVVRGETTLSLLDPVIAADGGAVLQWPSCHASAAAVADGSVGAGQVENVNPKGNPA